MKNIFLLCYFCISVNNLFSQSFSSHKIALTPTVYPSTVFDKEAYKLKLLNKYSGYGKSEILDGYIERQIIYREDFFSSNQVYSNWLEATEYVKKVFIQTIPKPFDPSEINIYIVRDPRPNAFCMEDGNIAVTVGLLSSLKTEAELAAVISHEYGHYYSEHLYKNFKKIESNKNFKAFVQNRSIIGSLIIAGDQSQYMQDQERQADTFAYHFFPKNGYAPKAIADNFIEYQKVEQHFKKLNKYHKPIIYFSTHPTTNERISNAQNAFKNSNYNGKEFQVDSLQFFSIRKHAIDETIYLLFDELSYDECLELAYLQYLYYPNDEFYLFFITECLRRQALIDKDFSKQFFITGEYKNINATSNTSQVKPVFLKGKYSSSLNPSNYAKSIFTNYKTEVYNLSDNELLNIKAKELVTNDTLEFLYNDDALNYFTSKIPAAACVFNVSRFIAKEPVVEGCANKPGNSDLENDLLQSATDYQTLKRNINSYKKAPIIIFDIKTFSATGKNFTDDVLYNELYKLYTNVASNYESAVIDTKNKFNFREYQRIQNTTSFMEDLNLKGLFRKKETNCDFASIFPELSGQLNKFNYKKLIFIELYAYGISSPEHTSPQLFGGEKWMVGMYVIDLLNNKINYTGKAAQSGNTREEKIKSLLDECMHIAEE